ncbi:hypothetical protein E3N88_44891 [Mikania micrantha]|uniref:Uncharacterized protein n=1 Tax=Mikania micrantha TaxID=192012 RepID=A0A5N6LBC7_9ASTR|nr:hypothetical protein E3N88_44891 [Mikania micrantha]
MYMQCSSVTRRHHIFHLKDIVAIASSNNEHPKDKKKGEYGIGLMSSEIVETYWLEVLDLDVCLKESHERLFMSTAI